MRFRPSSDGYFHRRADLPARIEHDKRRLPPLELAGDAVLSGQTVHAGVAELVDALDLGSSDFGHGGSSPFARTNGLWQRHQGRQYDGRGAEPARFISPDIEDGIMEVTETKTDGLKHEFTVRVGASDIERRVADKLSEIGRSIRLPGFRPGKVPMSLLKQRYGRSVMGEVLESAVGESSTQAINERGLRAAMKPRIEVKSFEEGADLEYSMAVEVLPDITPPDFASIELERLTPEIEDSEIESALNRLAERHRKSEAVTEERPAASGDIVVIDFKGSIDGTEFPGGAGTDFPLELGSGSFIPGFEDQLIGAKVGEHRTVAVNFPEDYGHTELAGKEASFAVDIKELKAPSPLSIDDNLAEAVGMDNLEALKTAIREQLQRDYAGVSRARLKRQLLDRLADTTDFAVPEGMVDMEFNSIWQQLEAEKERVKAAQASGQDSGGEAAEASANEGEAATSAADSTAEPEEASSEAAQSAAITPEATTSDDEESQKADYRKIAERRVRLGLLLSEVGRQNNITVAPEELNRALTEEARRHPGYEKQVVEYYRNHPEALSSLQAPIYEDKVVDFIVELAKVEERKVTPAELMAPLPGDEEEEAA